jgi:TctA family transporter
MINYIKRLYNWFVIPWPLHLLPIFIVIHAVGLVVFSKNVDDWNLFSSTFLQLYGGWFVIKTINDNLGILSSSSIMQSLRDYFKSFPAYKLKSITANMSGTLAGVGTLSTALLSSKKLKTTKEKVDFLLKEIERLDRANKELKIELLNKVENVKTSLENSIKDQKNEIEKVQTRITATLVGGVKEETLGILCIIYSLFIPYVTLLMNYLIKI